MDKLFIKWLKDNMKKFEQLDIKLNNYQEIRNGENTAVTITHETQFYMGQITVRDSGDIDIEVLSNETEEMVFNIYCMAKNGINFDSLFDNYIQCLIKN